MCTTIPGLEDSLRSSGKCFYLLTQLCNLAWGYFRIQRSCQCGRLCAWIVFFFFKTTLLIDLEYVHTWYLALCVCMHTSAMKCTWKPEDD